MTTIVTIIRRSHVIISNEIASSLFVYTISVNNQPVAMPVELQLVVKVWKLRSLVAKRSGRAEGPADHYMMAIATKMHIQQCEVERHQIRALSRMSRLVEHST